MRIYICNWLQIFRKWMKIFLEWWREYINEIHENDSPEKLSFCVHVWKVVENQKLCTNFSRHWEMYWTWDLVKIKLEVCLMIDSGRLMVAIRMNFSKIGDFRQKFPNSWHPVKNEYSPAGVLFTASKTRISFRAPLSGSTLLLARKLESHALWSWRTLESEKATHSGAGELSKARVLHVPNYLFSSCTRLWTTRADARNTEWASGGRDRSLASKSRNPHLLNADIRENPHLLNADIREIIFKFKIFHPNSMPAVYCQPSYCWVDS